MKLTHPLPGFAWRGSYGWRDGFWENGTYIPPMFHEGEDFSAPAGTPIRAAHAGTVVSNYHDTTGGWMVTIQSGNMRTRYLHMQAKAPFAIGATVKAGQVIGAVGSTGLWTTGPHLHFEVWVNGKVRDPKPYLTVTNSTILLGRPKMFMIWTDAYKNDAKRPGRRWAVVGAGFWKEIYTQSEANNVNKSLGGGAAAHVDGPTYRVYRDAAQAGMAK